VPRCCCCISSGTRSILLATALFPASGQAQETIGPALNDSWAQNVPASRCFVAVLLSGVAVLGAHACT
jgi:hypothetical protein